MFKLTSVLYGILTLSLFGFIIYVLPNYIYAITPALNGTNQDDFLVRINVNQSINGGLGDDIIFSNKGNGPVDGGPGTDIIFAGPGGNSTIDGGPGDDTIVGTKGNFSIDGGPGADTIIINGGKNNFRGIQMATIQYLSFQVQIIFRADLETILYML